MTCDFIPEVHSNLILSDNAKKTSSAQREKWLQGLHRVPDTQVLPSLLAHEQKIWKAEVVWQIRNCVIGCSLIVYYPT